MFPPAPQDVYGLCKSMLATLPSVPEAGKGFALGTSINTYLIRDLKAAARHQ
jgi:hypothetical protein